MRYKALVSFSGEISMAKGEVRELSDSPIVKSLLEANYIEQDKKKARKTEAKK